ncbi:MAG: FumA C-terminus/TtdB family hydratase beta subunit [Oscillospiraceae bacterium]|jgi:fumarate hydratase subunit beta|nr:FumA C-terminus/TtdB family hydratase beta subunit [Oscillospiraceae bacterium]
MIAVHTGELREAARTLEAGARVLLSGTVYTARDAAHQRIVALLDEGGDLPFPLDGACVYYAGPTPARPGQVIGSCGPTTSDRMDPYTPRLLALGLCGMIGKGGRAETVCQAMQAYGAVYFCAVGGAGALAAQCVRSCEEIAFHDLGCESVKRLEMEAFPLVVAVDARGGNLFRRAEARA